MKYNILILIFFHFLITETKAQSGKLADGITYQILGRQAQGQRVSKIVINDFVTFHLVIKNAKDSILYTTYPDKPATKQMAEINKKENYEYADRGFLHDMLAILNTGDSVIYYVDADFLTSRLRLKNKTGIEPGSQITYTIKVLETQNYNQIKLAKEIAAFDQLKKDTKIISEYLAKNGIKARKTSSGLWYVIHEEGSGISPSAMDVVRVNYEGKLLDGTLFGSSELNKEPLEFPVEAGIAIKGLDEGIRILKEGAKATFYIPSGLAYGEKEAILGIIPPNSILVLDIDFLQIIAKNIPIEKSLLLGEVENENKENNQTDITKVQVSEDVGKTQIKPSNDQVEKYETDIKKRGFFDVNKKKKKNN